LADQYTHIIALLQAHGEVLTEHLGSDQEIRKKDRVLSDRQIHDRDLQWIMEADMVIAEVTVPSLGVGYEIGRALHLGKPVLCLYHTGAVHSLSAMVSGCADLEIVHYTHKEELQEPLTSFISNHAKD
jgi:nucleoside 2-deoxyribosyltransferase